MRRLAVLLLAALLPLAAQAPPPANPNRPLPDTEELERELKRVIEVYLGR